MMITAVTDLRREETWDPFTLASRSINWPDAAWPERSLGELTTQLSPSGWAAKGTAVVVPAFLEAHSGWFRKRSTNYFGPAYQIGLDVLEGDILVPRGDAPAVLVDESLRGSLASSRFVAIRPVPGLAVWLWGVLNSRAGVMHRALMASARTGADVAELLFGLIVPVPPLGHIERVSGRIAAVSAAIDRTEEEAPGSWWAITDLRDFDWRLALATPHPERIAGDTLLGSLAPVIERGRRVPDLLISGAPTDSMVPVVDVAVLSGEDVTEWVPPSLEDLVYAEPGNVLLVTTGPRARARVVTERCAFEGSVLCIRVLDPHLSPAIANFFNAGPGVGLRRLFQSGSIIPALSIADTRRMPISYVDLREPEAAEVPLTLTARLEAVLWG